VVTIGIAAQSAQELYQRGLVQENGRGDLKQAIALYTQAAKAAGKDRALAAKSLLRIAGSHEKLGADGEAEQTYAELLRAYPEQRAEVAVAQQRLQTLRVKSKSGHTAAALPPTERVPDPVLAARLAAFLWSGAPDRPLLDAARRGDFHDPEALTRHAARMLRDARARALVDSFFAPWAGLDRLKSAKPDPVQYFHVDAALLQAMDTETRMFVQSQLRDDRDAVELWTASYTYVNERLARHYGLPGVTGDEFRRVTWPNASRAGLLGQAGPLTAHSMGSRTSPTARGIFVLINFLGTDPMPPPSNIAPMPEGPGVPAPIRERMTIHRTNPACASCHATFDPLGLALENFDAVGGWRTTDGGVPIDASGVLADGTRFNGPAGLRAALLKYRSSYYVSVTQQLLSHALNRKRKNGRVYDYEMPAVRKIVNDAAAHGYRWSSIIAGIAASEPFQAKEIVP
jgi:hypothetical protein